MGKETHGSGSNRSTVEVQKPTPKKDSGWQKADTKAPKK